MRHSCHFCQERFTVYVEGDLLEYDEEREEMIMMKCFLLIVSGVTSGRIIITATSRRCSISIHLISCRQPAFTVFSFFPG